MTTSMSSVASGEEGGKSVGIQRRKILPTKEGVRGSVLGRGKRGGGLGSSDSEEDRSERKRKRRRSGGGLGGPGGTAGSLGERFGMLRAGSRTGSGSRALGEGVEDELKGRGVLARTPRGDDDPDDAPYLELKQEFSPSGSGRRRTVVCDRRLPVDSRPRRRASLESPIGMPPWMQKVRASSCSPSGVEPLYPGSSASSDVLSAPALARYAPRVTALARPAPPTFAQLSVCIAFPARTSPSVRPATASARCSDSYQPGILSTSSVLDERTTSLRRCP